MTSVKSRGLIGTERTSKTESWKSFPDFKAESTYLFGIRASRHVELCMKLISLYIMTRMLYSFIIYSIIEISNYILSEKNLLRRHDAFNMHVYLSAC